MRVGRKKRRGLKKTGVFSSLQAVEFDIDAIREIKRRKKRVCERIKQEDLRRGHK